MKTTFLNGDAELQEKGRKYLNSRREDFKGFIKHGFDPDGNPSNEAAKFFDQTGSFFDYGLAFDFVSVDTFSDQSEGYYRYQLSWGGPSDEIRFYQDGRIEYVYLDWGTGVGFDVAYQDWAQWLKNTFEEFESINWNSIPHEEIYP